MRVGTWSDGITALIRRETREDDLSLSTCTMKRPCKHTVRFSASKEGGFHPNWIMLAPDLRFPASRSVRK